jgi:hypothetical protein
MDTIAMNTHEKAGPFEQWMNPITGEETAFVTFPVVNGRMNRTVCLTDYEDGYRRTWEITYTPAVANRSAMLHVWGDAPLLDTIGEAKPDTAEEGFYLTEEEFGDGRRLVGCALLATMLTVLLLCLLALMARH